MMRMTITFDNDDDDGDDDDNDADNDNDDLQEPVWPSPSRQPVDPEEAGRRRD